jgi:hypothetical protein
LSASVTMPPTLALSATEGRSKYTHAYFPYDCTMIASKWLMWPMNYYKHFV